MRRLTFVSALAMISACAFAYAGAADPVRLHGTVVLDSRDTETTFTIRTAAAEHVFRVWSERGLQLHATYPDADIEFYGTSLVIVAPSAKRLMTFAVDGHTAPRVPVPEGFGTTSYTVSGLGHEITPGGETPPGQPAGRRRARVLQRLPQ